MSQRKYTQHGVLGSNVSNNSQHSPAMPLDAKLTTEGLKDSQNDHSAFASLHTPHPPERRKSIFWLGSESEEQLPFLGFPLPIGFIQIRKDV